MPGIFFTVVFSRINEGKKICHETNGFSVR